MLLRAARGAFPALDWTVVDIADDNALFERYGWLIPVLRAGDDAELRWPFDATSLASFLRRSA